MKLIIGLGNPGVDYQNTRHNFGYHSLDFLAKKFNTGFESKPKWKADLAEFSYQNQKILLIKPTGFYNLTGQTVQTIIQFFKIDSMDDLLVIHDDLDLEFGIVRSRKSGSDAGNNGLKSIIAQIGTKFNRIKIGTKNPILPHVPKSSFVLSRFSITETKKLPQILEAVSKLTDDFLSDHFEATKITVFKSDD